MELDKEKFKKLVELIDEIGRCEIAMKRTGIVFPLLSDEEIKENVVRYFVVGDIWMKSWFPELNIDELENNTKFELESSFYNRIEIYYSKYVEQGTIYPGTRNINEKLLTSFEVYKPYFDMVKEIKK